MADNDVFASLVSFVAELGHEVAILLTDPDARADLLARAGRLSPALPPAADPERPRPSPRCVTAPAPTDRSRSNCCAILPTRWSMSSPLCRRSRLDSVDAAWNLLATLIDLVAVDRLRTPIWGSRY